MSKQSLPFGGIGSIFPAMRTEIPHSLRRAITGQMSPSLMSPGRMLAGLLPGCPGAAPLHDHALLPWRFHPLFHAADGIL